MKIDFNNKCLALFIITHIFFLFDGIIYANDMDTLLDRLRLEYMKEIAGNGQYLNAQLLDGSWSDINYETTSRTNFIPIRHLSRLKSMSIAYNTEANKYYHDKDMLNGISKGLEYWYQKKPESENWWFNDIGQQMPLNKILLLMQNYLNTDVVNTGMSYLKNPDLTGQNLVDISVQTIHRGLLSKNIDDLKLGIKAIGSTMEITDDDGIKPDFSFHQHEKQLYNGGYGLEFVEDVAFWIYITRDLSFTFNEYEVATFADYLLDGIQWMTYKTDIDFLVTGRSISRQNKLNNGKILLPALEYMYKLGRPDSTNFSSYINHINGATNSLTGNKHFWCSDYHSHRRANYAVSVRMWSDRVMGGESMNGENTEGYYLSSGAMYMASNKDSYYNLPPVWDWCRIPGVTCPHWDTPPRMPSSWWSFYGSSSFVGGVSNGIYGAATMDLNLDNVTGKKAWFFFDDEIVALGAGINSTNNVNICTSINQCLLRDSVTAYSTSEINCSRGEYQLNTVKWIFHDDIAYVFPEPSNVYLKNKALTGNWNSINGMYSDEEIRNDVFSLWIDHGVRPVDESYQYIILPGMNKEKITDYVNDFPVKVLKNNKYIQAVKNKQINVTGIVFHEISTLKINDSLSIRTNKPCILLLDEKNASISATNPLNAPMELEVVIIIKGKNTEKIIFNFPAGMYAGESITKSVMNITSIKNIKNDLNNFIIYPNPTKDNFKISGLSGPSEVTVYNFHGDKVKQVNNQDFISITELKAGLYLIKIKTENNINSRLIIKQ